MRSSARPTVASILTLSFALCAALGGSPADARGLDDDAKPPAKSAASDDSKKSKDSSGGSSAGLTERERMLLDRVEQLEKRVAELESGRGSSGAAGTAASVAPATNASASAPTNTTSSVVGNTPANAASTVAANAPTNGASSTAAANAAAVAATPSASAAPAAGNATTGGSAVSAGMSSSLQPNAAATVATANQATTEKAPPSQPFGFADFTWLNGNARTKDLVWDSKYFTPEFRVDTQFMKDYNQPKDHTMGGSTESFRSGEVQLEQLSFGGDLHVGNVRGRILTMFGMFATTTPRNDASAGVGQWNLNDAYRYFSEAYGGYHFNVNHGLNIDAGIFVSYIGLFSYYNFDNWAYQPSYVSSNTPWFFNGVRIQWFPTEKLKIEPWIINGWQSYAKFNGRPGLGGQVLYRPNGKISIVSNNYGMGTDTLGNPGRSRIHTDDSIEVKYYDNPEKTLDKMAFSLTGDLGCEYRGGVSCYHNTRNGPKQSFAGWMLYNRMWFHNDKFGLTIGGGKMDNPGRYLTLLPPINGATAVSGSPYFPGFPGSIYKAYDGTVTFDWMPTQYITFRFENGYRHANVPYWTGRQGITPPGGNVAPVANNGVVGTAASYICTNGSSSAVSAFAPTQLGFITDNAKGAVSASCTATYGSGWSAWQPDLRKGQAVSTIAILVKF